MGLSIMAGCTKSQQTKCFDLSVANCFDANSSITVTGNSSSIYDVCSCDYGFASATPDGELLDCSIATLATYLIILAELGVALAYVFHFKRCFLVFFELHKCKLFSFKDNAVLTATFIALNYICSFAYCTVTVLGIVISTHPLGLAIDTILVSTLLLVLPQSNVFVYTLMDVYLHLAKKSIKIFLLRLRKASYILAIYSCMSMLLYVFNVLDFHNVYIAAFTLMMWAINFMSLQMILLLSLFGIYAGMKSPQVTDEQIAQHVDRSSEESNAILALKTLVFQACTVVPFYFAASAFVVLETSSPSGIRFGDGVFRLHQIALVCFQSVHLILLSCVFQFLNSRFQRLLKKATSTVKTNAASSYTDDSSEKTTKSTKSTKAKRFVES